MIELTGNQVVELEEPVQQLKTALVSNRVIATAIGLTMWQHRVDRPQALSFLVEQSQRTNTRLSAVALGVVVEAEADLRRDCA